MATSKDNRVDFSNPPVVEVAVAVQFESITKLTTPHLGRFWELISDDFPRVEEHVPRPPSFETFPREQSKVRQFLVQLAGSAPVSRCWFISEDESQLLQIQSDRLVFNWRKKSESQEYPRYEFVRERFDTFVSKFRSFLQTYELGEVRPNQCEISYVNNLGQLTSGVREFTPLWRGEFSDDFLPQPENSGFNTSFEMHSEPGGKPAGRLHVMLRQEAAANPVVLRLTARGRPQPETMEGVNTMLNLGRKWIVNGFVSVTTPKMHQKWGIQK